MSSFEPFEIDSMTIGKLASRLELNVETIRYYQREGLIKEPAKRLNGYRYYGKDHYLRLVFIKRAKDLGFTLNEIKEILRLNTNRNSSCEKVNTSVEAKIKEIDQKIKDLNQIKESLITLKKACAVSEEEMKKFSMLDCFINDCKC